jgi:hypothetical protein
MDNAPIRRAKDEDLGSSERNVEQAKIALEHNERRGANAIDEEEAEHPIGCRCDRPECVKAFEKQTAAADVAATKRKPVPPARDRKSIIADMMKLTARDAAAVSRNRLQAAKEAKRKKAIDRAARQRAYDDAVAAGERADEERAQAKDAAFHTELRMSRQRWEGRPDFGMEPVHSQPPLHLQPAVPFSERSFREVAKRSFNQGKSQDEINADYSASLKAMQAQQQRQRGIDAEPEDAAEIAEIGPEIESGPTDPITAFDREWRKARVALEGMYLQK